MEPKLVDFSVMKQKIIKTDEVLQMYMENNKKLKKTQQAYKDLKSKYEEASSGLNRFQLESDRCTFSLQHITSKHNKLESEYKHLEQQNKSLEQKYCKHIVDSQTAILDLENELRMIKELNESAELLSSSPKKKLATTEDKSPKKINELEEVVKKLKQNEAKFKQENDKLLLEQKELVGDMKKIRNEHSKIISLSQEERSKLVIELNGLKSQLASKQTHYNDVLLAKDKEISKLNADVLALRGLKEQLKCLKEENKKLYNDIRCKDIARQKEKLLSSCTAQTQTTQDIKSVLEENILLKTEMKKYKSRTSKCESTQTESDEECESLEEIFKEMMLPRMISPLPDERSNVNTLPLPQSEDKYSASEDYTKEKSDPDVFDDKSIFKPLVQKVVPFVIKEECFNNQSEMKGHFGYVSETSANNESKADIPKDYTSFTTGGLKTEAVCGNSQHDDEITLPKADWNHDLTLSLKDSKENHALFEDAEKESHTFENQSSVDQQNSQVESELSFTIADNPLYHGTGLSSKDNKNLPLFGASVGDSQEFKNQPSLNDLKIKENLHPGAESTPSRVDDEQFVDKKENFPCFDASQGESQEIRHQPSKDEVDIKKNPQLVGDSALSTTDEYLHHSLGWFGHNEENIPLSEESDRDFKNQPLMNVLKVKENALLKAEWELSPSNIQTNLGIALPSMKKKENLHLFEDSLGESQEIGNQQLVDDSNVKRTPQLGGKSTLSAADNQLYHKFSQLSVENEDLVGASQASINVPSVKGNSQFEAESTLFTANNQRSDGISLPCMDDKENLPLSEAPEGESQELENKPSKIEDNIREDSEALASCSNVKKSKTTPRRKCRLPSKVSDSTRPGFRAHPPTSRQIFRKEMRMRKCRRVDSVLRALQVLKRSKINFTISNESTLPQQWKDPNWLDRFSGAPMDFGQPARRRMRVKNPVSSGRTNVKPSTRKLSCPAKACKSMCMSLDSRCGTANLLGFFNVKQETISPLGEPLDKKPDSPLKWLNDSLHSDQTMETLLEKLAELVSEKLKNDKHTKRKRTVSPPSQDSEFCSETETELERLIEAPSYDVLERNKMLLKRAKYDLGRESTSMTSLETSDTKNSVGSPPFVDIGLKTEQLEAATTYQNLDTVRKHSLPPVVTRTAVRALWNKPSPKGEPSEVTAQIFENADSCDSYKFTTCPNLLSPLSSCAADSPKIRHFNLTPKKEETEIDFKSPERKELANICKLEQKSELLSPIRRIDELRKQYSAPLQPFEIKRENLGMAVKMEASQLEIAMENVSTTVETSDSGYLKVLEKTDLEKLGCSGIEGLFTDISPEKLDLAPISQPETLITPHPANNSPGVEPHTQLSSNPSGSLENTSPPASITHRSFQFLNVSNLRQYTNKSKNRKSLTNANCTSKENYTLSRFPVDADPKQTPPLSQFVCKGLLKPIAELEVGPPDGKTIIEDFSLPLTSLNQTDILSVSLRDMEIQEISPTRGSFIDPQESAAELNNAEILNASSCISDLLANESQITKEIDSFMTTFDIDRSFTQASTSQNEKTGRNVFETAGKNLETVSRKISAGDILDILPRSEDVLSSEEEEGNDVPSCPQSPELQSASADFAPKVIPLERNLAIAEEELAIYKKRGKEIPSCPQSPKLHSASANFALKVIPLERNLATAITDAPITDTSITDTPRSEELPIYKKQEKEVPSCPQSSELQSAFADFALKVIPLKRNLATVITDAPITDTSITDTPISEELPIYKKQEKEASSCPQSPELQSDSTDFAPKVIPLERNLGMAITDTPITDTPITDTSTTDIITDTSITDTSRSEEELSIYGKQEKELPKCPQSPELQSAPADLVPKVIPLEKNLARAITDTPKADTLIIDIPITHTTMTGIPITDLPVTGTSITDDPRSVKVLLSYGKQEEKEVASCPQSPELQPASADFAPTVIPLEVNLAMAITDTPITDALIIDIPITYSAMTGIPITGTPITYTNTPITDIPPSDSPITDALVTDVSITDTPRSVKVLSSYEKQEESEVPSCPQSPELQSGPADFVPKVIPLHLIMNTPVFDTTITGTPITRTPRTCSLITSTPITGITPTYTPITDTDLLVTDNSNTDTRRAVKVLSSYEKQEEREVPNCPLSPELQSAFADFVPKVIPLHLIMDTPVTFTTITGTPNTGIPNTCDPNTGSPNTGTPRTCSSITSIPIKGITPTYTLITNTPVTDTSVTDTSVTDAPVTDSPITDTPINDTPVTKQKIKKVANADNVVTRGKSKMAQRRSKRLSKAVISSSSEAESEDDVCERLKESTTNVNTVAVEQVKRKRGRPRIFPPKILPPKILPPKILPPKILPPKEIVSAGEKVVRKRGRPRKYPVQEISADESESKRSCLETHQSKDIVESNEDKTDVADSGEGQKLANGVSQPAENCSSVAPKKVLKPKQKISKLKSNVMRQMKLKQKMFQSDKPGFNFCPNNDSDVERNEVMGTNLEISNDRLYAESNSSQHEKVAKDIGEKLSQPKAGYSFCSNNDSDVKGNDLIEPKLDIRNNRLSVGSNNSRYEKLARDPDKRITVVQDIIIRAGHKTNYASCSNFRASSSQNGGDNIPQKGRRPKKSCDILSQIMGDMDKVRPKAVPKKSDAPKKILPQGLDDKQWRRGILDIAEVTHNKDVEAKESSDFLGPGSKTESGILKKGIEMPGKIKCLVKKLMEVSNEDEIPDHVIVEFKKLQVDIIVDVIIHVVAKDFIEKPDTKHFPAPLMTKTQRIYLALMLKLEQKKVEQLIDKFLVRARHYILKRGCGLKAAIPLTRLIIGVCRIRADIHTMRMFCCDAFFFIGDLAVPILFTVLTSWTDVIPMEADVKNYPMAKVLVQLVHLKTFSKQGYNLFALKCLLNQFYGYPKERLNCDTLFEEVFHDYLRNPSPSSDLAIRLYCRNKDTKWVYKKINEFFIPLIYKIPTENENFKATTILLLGKICRQFRLKEEHDSACLVEMNRFFAGLLEDDVTDMVKRSVSLTIDRLPRAKKKIPKEEKQTDSKEVLSNERKNVRKNATKFLPNSNWGYQNNRKGKQGFQKKKWAHKKKALRKGTLTKVSTGQ